MVLVPQLTLWWYIPPELPFFYVAPSFDLFFCMRRLFILSDKNVHNRTSEGRTNIRPAGGVATRLLLQTNQIEKSLISFRRHPDGKKSENPLSAGYPAAWIPSFGRIIDLVSMPL